MASMKYFPILLTVAVAFFAMVPQKKVDAGKVYEDMPAVKTAQNTCRKKSGVSDDVYIAALERTEIDYNDSKLQGYAACMFDEMSLIDDNNKIEFGAFIETLDAEKKAAFAEHLLGCQGEVDDPDKGKKCLLFYKCIQQKMGSKFYFV